MPVNIHLGDLTRTKIVYMILNRRTEETLHNLSNFYNITPPEIAVEIIKGKRRSVYADYVQKEGKICVNNSYLLQPFCNLTVLSSYKS
jgi:hypothetical protein